MSPALIWKLSTIYHVKLSDVLEIHDGIINSTSTYDDTKLMHGGRSVPVKAYVLQCYQLE